MNRKRRKLKAIILLPVLSHCKVDTDGEVMWSKAYAVRSWAYFRRVLAMDDGSIIAVDGTRYHSPNF